LPVFGIPFCGFPGQSLPMSCKRLIQYFIALLCSLPGWQDNKVHRVVHIGAHHPGAKTFPDYTLDAIATNCPGTGFFGYSHAKAVTLYSINPGHNPETVVT